MELFFTSDYKACLLVRAWGYKAWGYKMTTLADRLNDLLPEEYQIQSCELITRYDDEVMAYYYCWLYSTGGLEYLKQDEWNKARDIIFRAWNVFYEDCL